MRDGCGCEHGVPWFNEAVLWFECCFLIDFRIFRISHSFRIHLFDFSAHHHSSRLIITSRLTHEIPPTVANVGPAGLPPVKLRTQDINTLSSPINHHGRTNTFAREFKDPYARLPPSSHNPTKIIHPHLHSSTAQQSAQLPSSRTTTTVSHINSPQHHNGMCPQESESGKSQQERKRHAITRHVKEWRGEHLPR